MFFQTNILTVTVLSYMLIKFIPAIGWLRNYPREHLSGDLNAGVTVGIMLIPQGLAYALIAGLPPIYGLYAALVPVLIYALFGTSGQLAVGPVAMVSLLVATGVSDFAPSGSAEYIQMAILLAFLVGLIQFLLGILRFGFITNFLSHPVLSGFTSAAALVIGLNQLKHLVGLPIPRSGGVFEILKYVAVHVAQIQIPTLVIGLAGIAIILILRRLTPRFPGALIAVIVATLAVWTMELEGVGVAIVGSVPVGLPVPSISFFSVNAIRELLPIALAISLVGFMESIAVAKAFASKNRTTINPSQELTALGLANMAGSLFHSYPTTGGFSRSAVNDQAGAKTPLASLVSAGIVGLTLLFLTPLFHFLPKALLASIVMVAVVGLVDVREIRFLWRSNRSDLALLALTFVSTLVLGIEKGILIGVASSVLTFIYQASRPHMARLGRIDGSDVYRNIERYSEAHIDRGIAIFRIDASLFFGNVEFVRDALSDFLDSNDTTKVLILDLYPVNRIDSSAQHAMFDLHRKLSDGNVHLLLSGVKGPVRDAFENSGLSTLLGEDAFFLRIDDANQRALAIAGSYLDDGPAEDNSAS